MNDNLRNLISDMFADLFYYDRKEDEDMPRGSIELMVKSGEVTEKEILDVMSYELHRALQEWVW